MRTENKIFKDSERRTPAIVFLCIALVFLLAVIGFFAWHTVRMRSFELNYVKINGTAVDVEERHRAPDSSHHALRTGYYLVISYTFDAQDYTFTDRMGHNYSVAHAKIGTSAEVYVNPRNPNQAETVTSSGFVSIICACFFAFFCVTYSVGKNLLLSITVNTFNKRLAFVWGIEILLGVAFLLLFWVGLPYSGFGEVFVRIQGAVGVTVVLGLVLCAVLIDGIITCRLKSMLR